MLFLDVDAIIPHTCPPIGPCIRNFRLVLEAAGHCHPHLLIGDPALLQNEPSVETDVSGVSTLLSLVVSDITYIHPIAPLIGQPPLISRER